MIEISLPYPPSVNHYKQAGRLVRTASGKLYQARVNTGVTKRYYYDVWVRLMEFRAATSFLGFGRATIAMEMDVYPPDKRKRDLDGILKVSLDAMQRAELYADDFNIARLLVTRKDIIEHGQLIVRIQELS